MRHFYFIGTLLLVNDVLKLLVGIVMDTVGRSSLYNIILYVFIVIHSPPIDCSN